MTFYSVNSPTPLDTRVNNEMAIINFIFLMICIILCLIIFLLLLKV